MSASIRVRAGLVIAAGLLLALGATGAQLSPPAATPGASLTVRLPQAVQLVVVALLAFAFVLLLAVQRRRRPSEGEDLPAAAEPHRSAWAAAFSLLPLLLLVGTVWYLVRTRGAGADGDPIERAFSAIAGLLDLLAATRKPSTSMPLFDLTIAVLLLLLALAVFALMVLVALAPRLEKWWAARGVAEAAPPPSDHADGPGDPRAEPDPRAAIIRAYGRFEHAVAAARAPRLPCQTPAEFMRTTLARLPVPAPSVTRLTALFEIARFSDRPVGAEARDTACDCLDEIMAALDPEPPRGR